VKAARSSSQCAASVEMGQIARSNKVVFRAEVCSRESDHYNRRKFFSDIHVSDGLRTSKEDRTDIEYSRHPQNAALHRRYREDTHRYREDTHKTPRYTERYQSDPEPVASGSRRAASARPIALRSGNGRAKDVLMRRSSAGGSLDLPDDGARSREFSALQGRIGASRRRLGNCGWERSP
jgi:hypothetical protein